MVALEKISMAVLKDKIIHLSFSIFHYLFIMWLISYIGFIVSIGNQSINPVFSTISFFLILLTVYAIYISLPAVVLSLFFRKNERAWKRIIQTFICATIFFTLLCTDPGSYIYLILD